MLVFFFCRDVLLQWICGSAWNKLWLWWKRRQQMSRKTYSWTYTHSQILLIWQIDLLEPHPFPVIAAHDAHMKDLLKLSYQHIPVDNMYGWRQLIQSVVSQKHKTCPDRRIKRKEVGRQNKALLQTMRGGKGFRKEKRKVVKKKKCDRGRGQGRKEQQEL